MGEVDEAVGRNSTVKGRPLAFGNSADRDHCIWVPGVRATGSPVPTTVPDPSRTMIWNVCSDCVGLAAPMLERKAGLFSRPVTNCETPVMVAGDAAPLTPVPIVPAVEYV